MRGVLLLAALVCAGLPGCVRIPLVLGDTPGLQRLDSALEPGRSRRGDVIEALGPPPAVGEALFPFHDEPRAVWTYYEQDTELGRTFVFVFFREGYYDGYMWFSNLPGSGSR